MKKKPLVATCYVVEWSDGTWVGDQGDARTFARASLYATRADANRDAREIGASTGRKGVVVPCRVRPLTSKKRNAKRTR